MLWYILGTLVVLLAVFVVFVAMRPAEFRITRKATLSAPPPVVFAEVNDFHMWQVWSPWAKLDPAARSTYEGEPSGVGAIFTWDGNSKVGAGRMTIMESRPSELIRINLEFLRPFKTTNTAEFTFKSKGDHTQVTWTMVGHNGFMGKAFGLFMDMDKMIGKDFEKGLANLQGVVEKTTS